MAKFIKLTTYDKPFVVNVAAIEWVRAPDKSYHEEHFKGGSLVQLRSQRTHVAETPEQILALIERGEAA